MAHNQAEFNQLLEKIRSNSYTETALSLSYKGLDDNDAQQLAQALAANTTITNLNLGDNEIGDAGVQALALNATITTLGLFSNRIGDTGAQALAANTTINKLNLASNEIGDAGAQALAANTTITTLDLGGNEIGDAGAQALAANITITTLNLAANEIGNAGAQALAANATITSLDLRSYQMGNRDTIYRALNENNNAKRNLCFAFHLFGKLATQERLMDLPRLPDSVVTIISKYLQDNKLEHNPDKFRELEFRRLSIML